MKILILAFKNTVTETIAKDLRISTKKVYLESNKEWIERFVTQFDFAEYDYILALGEYNGRDKDTIRIETECSSQFRNNKERLEELTIPYFLKPEPPFKLVNGIGNSWCNLISYRMLSKSPEANYTFLHIPKNFEVTRAMEAIRTQLICIDNE